MRLSLWQKFACFVVLTLLIHSLLYVVFWQWQRKKSVLLKTEQLLSEKGNFDYLFMGNSHVARGIDTTIIPKSFNYAFYGENNIRTYYKLKKVLENPKITFKYLILSNEPTTHSSYLYGYRKNNYYYTPFINAQELSQITKKYQHLLYAAINRIIPYTELLGMLANSDENSRRKQKEQWNFKTLSVEDRQKNAQNAVNTLLENGDAQNLYHPVSLIFLEKTLSLCKSKNIAVIFINYPLSSVFLEALQAKTGNVTAKSDSIIQKYAGKIIDYKHLFVDCDEYFLDSHHLNKNGGEALSIQLKNDIVALQKQGKL